VGSHMSPHGVSGKPWPGDRVTLKAQYNWESWRLCICRKEGESSPSALKSLIMNWLTLG